MQRFVNGHVLRRYCGSFQRSAKMLGHGGLGERADVASMQNALMLERQKKGARVRGASARHSAARRRALGLMISRVSQGHVDEQQGQGQNFTPVRP